MEKSIIKNTILFSLFFFLILFLTNCNSDTDEIDSTPLTYEVGQPGPAGGIVFYDKGAYSDGWRYIEAAPSDLGSFQWGCYNQSIPEAQFLEIGTGLSNSEAILAFHDSLTNFYSNPETCSDLSDGTVAAKECLDLELGGFDNWHLPSQDEVFAMYENLHLNGLGDFDDTTLYWTSSEHDSNTATATDFDTADQGWLCKQCSLVVTVRAVRYF